MVDTIDGVAPQVLSCTHGTAAGQHQGTLECDVVRAALLQMLARVQDPQRVLESKLTDCTVAGDAGGFDVPRSVLLEFASKREYDGALAWLQSQRQCSSTG